MTSNLIHRSGAAGTSQDGDTMLASSGGKSGFYAEAVQEAEQRSVRRLFGGVPDGASPRPDGNSGDRGAPFAVSEQEADKTAVRQIMASAQGAGAPLPADLDTYLDEVEKQILLRALEQLRNNRTAAGASLGLSLRQMRYRMARLEISVGGDES